MHTHLHNVAKPIIACLLAVSTLASWSTPSKAEPPATQETPKPEVVLDAGTEADAAAAVGVVDKFLRFWDERNFDKAAALVAEPVRDRFLEEMKEKPIKLQSIDRIRLFKPHDQLLARVHASKDPSPSRKDLKKQEFAIDMVFLDEKWWVTAR